MFALFSPCLVFFCVEKCFYFLAQWIIILYIVEVIDELHMNFTLIELKLSLNWKLLKMCFEIQIGFFLL